MNHEYFGVINLKCGIINFRLNDGIIIIAGVYRLQRYKFKFNNGLVRPFASEKSISISENQIDSHPANQKFVGEAHLDCSPG